MSRARSRMSERATGVVSQDAIEPVSLIARRSTSGTVRLATPSVATTSQLQEVAEGDQPTAASTQLSPPVTVGSSQG